MKLPIPSSSYSHLNEARRNGIIEGADRGNHKRGRDVEIGSAKLILTSPNGSRYSIEVDNAGNISASAI